MKQLTRNEFTAKWLWLLFLLVIPTNIFSLLSNETISGFFPAFSIIGTIGTTICSFLYGIILIKLSSEYDYYKTAGICSILASTIDAILSFINSEGLGSSLFIGFIGIILALIATYYELTAHADILSGIDHDLNVKFKNLKLCFTISYGAILLCTIFTFILPLFAIIIMLIALVAILISGIMKFVYLYKSANIFKNLVKEENVSRETFLEQESN